jgi:hypothetical protein
VRTTGNADVGRRQIAAIISIDHSRRTLCDQAREMGRDLRAIPRKDDTRAQAQPAMRSPRGRPACDHVRPQVPVNQAADWDRIFAESCERIRELLRKGKRLTDWRVATVGPDYHVEFSRHFDSVPFQLIGAKVDLRVSPVALEVLHKHRRVASHLRSYVPGKHTTCKEHMPSAHRRYAEWTPERITAWAGETGPTTATVAAEIMRRRPHPEQGFRSCVGLISLGRKYTALRLPPCPGHRQPQLQDLKTLRTSGLDQAPAIPKPLAPKQPDHAHLRGAAYYEEVH